MTGLSALKKDLSGRLTKAGDQVTLDQAYFSQLGLTVSPDLDIIIQQALFPKTEDGKLILSRGDAAPTYTPDTPTDTLTVNKVQLPILFGLTSIACTLQFKLNGAQIDFTITLPITDLATTDMPLPGDFPGDWLDFGTQALIFSTNLIKAFSWQSNSVDLDEGLNFAALNKINPSGPLNTVLNFLLSSNNNPTIVLYGYIYPPRDKTSYPDLQLVAKLSGTVVSAGFVKLSNPRVGLQLLLNDSPTFFFTADLQLDAEINQLTAVISNADSKVLRLGIMPTDSNNFINIKTLLKQQINGVAISDWWNKILAGEIIQQIVEAVGLYHFSATVIFSNSPKIQDFQVVAGTTASIDVGGDKNFQIQSATITWNCLDPMGAIINHFSLEAKFQLFGHNFDAFVTDTYISGRSSDAIGMEDLLDNPPFQLDFDDIAVKWIYTGTKSLSLSANLNASFGILGDDAPFTIYDFAFTFTKSGTVSGLKQSPATGDSSLTVAFTGMIFIGAYCLSVQGDYNTTSHQWDFTASLDDDIPLSALVSNMFSDLGIDLSGIPELSLSGLTLSFHTGDTTKFDIAANYKLGSSTGAFELACKKNSSTQKWEFVAALKFKPANAVDLGSLVPVVGNDLKNILGLDSFLFLVTSKDVTGITLTNMGLGNTTIVAGITFIPNLVVDGDAASINIPVWSYENQTSHIAAQNNFALISNEAGVAPTGADHPTASVPIQKQVGPIYVKSLQIAFSKSSLSVVINGGILLGGIDIDFVGLSIGIPLSDPSNLGQYTAKLQGLNVAYKGSGALTVSGGLIQKVDKKGDTLYAGQILLKTGEFTLTAYGAYGKTPDGDHSSIFVFLLINYPLGGPPAFFVTGLSGGFGYNMQFNAPPAGELGNFPLIAGAVPGPTNPFTKGGEGSDPLAILLDANVIAVDVGENWAALGIMFNSFKMINSSVLVVVEWGDDLIINLLGLSTLILPVAEVGREADPIAVIQLGLRAVYDHNKGTLSVGGQLTPESYLLAKAMRLTGGFAFNYWFDPNEHAGDWVYTIGGYNPRYNKPEHYPSVPRLGFNWQLSDHLAIKGGGYFALTPTCVMAGGYLEVSYELDDLRAWLSVDANFLISWKPFHYYIEVGVSMGISYTIKVWCIRKTISVSRSVEVELWGQPFGGKARVDVYVFSISISFGDSNPGRPPVIPWQEFKQSFLPQHQGSPVEPYPTAQVVSGLIKVLQENPNQPPPAGADSSPASGIDGFSWIINPQEFILNVVVRIPIKEAFFNQQKESLSDANTKFGVGPSGVAPDDFKSSLSVTMGWRGSGGDTFKSDVPLVTCMPILKAAPKALWELLADPMNKGKDGSTIPNVCFGLQLHPPVFHPDFTVDVDILKLNFNLSDYLTNSFSSGAAKNTVFPNGIRWQPKANFKTLPQIPWETEQASIDDNARAREDILDLLHAAGCEIPTGSAVTIKKDYGQSLLTGPVYAGFGS